MRKKIIFIAIAIIFLACLVLATEYEWAGAMPVETDSDTFEWSGGAPYVVTEEAEEEAAIAIFFGMNF